MRQPADDFNVDAGSCVLHVRTELIWVGPQESNREAFGSTTFHLNHVHSFEKPADWALRSKSSSICYDKTFALCQRSSGPGVKRCRVWDYRASVEYVVLQIYRHETPQSVKGKRVPIAVSAHITDPPGQLCLLQRCDARSVGWRVGFFWKWIIPVCNPWSSQMFLDC